MHCNYHIQDNLFMPSFLTKKKKKKQARAILEERNGGIRDRENEKFIG